MSIQLDECYSIEADGSAWTLMCRKPVFDKTGERSVSKTTGEPTFSEKAAYHARLQYAMLHYLDESLKGSVSCVEVLERLKQAESRIFAACEARQ